MKKLIAIVLLALSISLFLTGCKLKNASKRDDAYYAYIASDIQSSSVNIKGFNGAASELTFTIPSDKWNMAQYKAGTYICIYVNYKDEILNIKAISEKDIYITPRDALNKENHPTVLNEQSMSK